MSLEHKAFVFDYTNFESRLKVILESALESGGIDQLENFIEQHHSSLKDPYEGESLPVNWQSMIETPDPHQYGDIALTFFYNPGDDIGLGNDWESVQEALSRKLSDVSLVLGSPVGPANNYFDPGKMGAYFQSPGQVATNMELLDLEEIESSPVVREMAEILQAAILENKGLYVTF
jgi:hypothetical protein